MTYVLPDLACDNVKKNYMYDKTFHMNIEQTLAKILWFNSGEQFYIDCCVVLSN